MNEPDQSDPFLGAHSESIPSNIYLRRARLSAYALGAIALLGSIGLAVKFPTWLWALPGACGLATLLVAATTREGKPPHQLMLRVLLCAVLGIGGLCLLLLPMKLR